MAFTKRSVEEIVRSEVENRERYFHPNEEPEVTLTINTMEQSTFLALISAAIEERLTTFQQ